MKNQSDVFRIVTEFKKNHGIQYGITGMGIFGSVARGEADEKSDVDIVVETKTPDPFLLVHVKEELEFRLKRKVDIVRLWYGMNPFLKKRIEKEVRYV